MTNEKKELFATLGLIAEESVANESVNPNENVVELTASESVDTELKELENIDSCYNEVEKASFESTVSDLELLNKALVYRNMRASGNKEEVYLESLSSEFGISTEGIKEIAEKGIKAGKAVIAKIVKLIKGLFGVEETKKKVVKQLLSKAKNAGLDKPVELEVTADEYQKYAQLFIHSYISVSQYDFNSGELIPAQGVTIPTDIKPLLDKYIDIFTNEAKEYKAKAAAILDAPESEQVKLLVEAIKTNNIFLNDPSTRPIEGLKELTVPSGFNMGQALIGVAKMLARDPFDKVWKDAIKEIEKSAEYDVPKELIINALVSCITNMRKFKQNVIRSLTVMMGKYISRYNKTKTEKTA